MNSPLSIRTVAYGPYAGQEGDLFQAGKIVVPAPVVVLLHGGFWRMPYGRDQLGRVAADLAALGYAVWNAGYRRLGQPGGGWPGTFADVAAALDQLADLAAEGAPLDLGRVVACGHSAGGQLAFWAAARGRREGPPGPRRVRPSAAAGLAPVADLRAAAALGVGDGAAQRLLGGEPAEVPGRYAAASPRELAPLGVPHLLLHGGRDEAVPISMSRGYLATARERGDDALLIEIPEAGHMDFLEPESEAHAELRRWLLTVAPPRASGSGRSGPREGPDRAGPAPGATLQ